VTIEMVVISYSIVVVVEQPALSLLGSDRCCGILQNPCPFLHFLESPPFRGALDQTTKLRCRSKLHAGLFKP